MRELSGRSGDVGMLFPAKTTSSPVAIRFLIILAAEAAEDEEENNNGGGGGAAAADAAWRRQLPVRSSMMLSIGSGARWWWCWCDSFAKRGLAAARSLCSRDKSSDSVAADVSEDMVVVVVVVVVGGSISKRDGGLGRGAGAFR
jgi:hypothetical protein